MHKIGMFNRTSPYSLEGFENSGADFMPEYKPYILDNKTIVVSPHKVYGPEQNDLVLQLRKKRVDQVILAGMSANLCVESHLRELLEQGFEVAVVRDATAAAMLPEGDGYLASPRRDDRHKCSQYARPLNKVERCFGSHPQEAIAISASARAQLWIKQVLDLFLGSLDHWLCDDRYDKIR